MTKKITTSRYKTGLQVAVLFVLPILLLYFDIIPVEYRFYVILSGMGLVLGLILFERWSLKELGIRLDNVKESIIPYSLLTLLSVLGVFALAKLLGHNTAITTEGNHFLYGFIILSFFQEFLFRSFLIPKLKVIFKSPVTIILSNAILFGFLHIIYPDTGLLFLLSTLLGIGFASVYLYRPNLILATISHSIINYIAVYYCFANLSEACL